MEMDLSPQDAAGLKSEYIILSMGRLSVSVDKGKTKASRHKAFPSGY